MAVDTGFMPGTGPDIPVPTGEVTYLFTDVVGSTAAWERNADDMHEALRIHDEVIRATFARHGGFVFSVAGDAFGAAFDDAADAVAAAVDLQLGLEQATSGAVAISARAGLHTGDALERDGNYFGTNVNRAARIQSKARGGQILASRRCVDLVGDRLPDGCSVVSIGETSLKSFDGHEDLWQVLGDGLSTDTSIEDEASTDRLPNPATRFVGRHDDVSSVAAELQPGALVSLVGLGGLGKTRLSIEVARASAGEFPDGVWWVDLTPLADGGGIGPAVTALLGIGQQQVAPIDAIVDRLGAERVLLVFDNCEHVIGGAADLASALHRRCPNVAILATSREPLGLSGERVWPVRPLTAAAESVELLLDRVAERDATLDTSSWDRQDLARLCERLDGMPLAIEMAAARLSTMSPREVLRRLEDRFRLLRSRQRDTSDRHRTLLAALDWSYELLQSDEQLLLDRLCVFGGTFDLAAVERVCADDELDEFDVIDLIASLAEKSLVVVLRVDGETRYRLLETVRQYGRTHLDDDAYRALRDRHLRHTTELMSDANDRWNLRTQADFDAAKALYVGEWDNVRDAVAWGVSVNDTERVGSLLESIWTFSFESFRFEVGDWANDALDMKPPPAVAYAMVALKSRRRRGRELIARALELVGPLDEPVGGASLIFQVDEGMKAAAGEREAAMQSSLAALFHASGLGPNDVAFQKAALADYLATDDPEKAADYAAAVHDFLAGSTNPMRSIAMSPLGLFEAASGRPDVGYVLCSEALVLASDAGLDWTESMAAVAKARLAMAHGVGDADTDVGAALRLHRQKRAWYALWFLISEALPWFRSTGRIELAHEIDHHLAANDIRSGDTRGTPSRMTRDELIDRVLKELETPVEPA